MLSIMPSIPIEPWLCFYRKTHQTLQRSIHQPLCSRLSSDAKDDSG